MTTFAGDVSLERRHLAPFHENGRSSARSKESLRREKQAKDQGCQFQDIEKIPHCIEAPPQTICRIDV